MSKFANIKLHENYELDPALAELINPLALRHPTITFGTQGYDPDQLQWNSRSRPVLGGPLVSNHTEDTRYMDKIKVSFGEELLGYVGVTTKNARSGGYEVMFFLNNWRLGERSGTSRETVRTTKLNVALRSFKKYFIPTSMLEAHEKGKESIMDAQQAALRTLRRMITQGNEIRSDLAAVQRHMYLMMNDLPVDVDISNKLKGIFTSDKYRKEMENYMLAQSMDGHSFLAVVQHHGMFMYQPHASEETVVQQTYEELPEFIQTGVAVLQLCQNNEVVRDVGYRYQSGMFAILVKS